MLAVNIRPKLTVRPKNMLINGHEGIKCAKPTHIRKVRLPHRRAFLCSQSATLTINITDAITITQASMSFPFKKRTFSFLLI